MKHIRPRHPHSSTSRPLITTIKQRHGRRAKANRGDLPMAHVHERGPPQGHGGCPCQVKGPAAVLSRGTVCDAYFCYMWRPSTVDTGCTVDTGATGNTGLTSSTAATADIGFCLARSARGASWSSAALFCPARRVQRLPRATWTALGLRAPWPLQAWLDSRVKVDRVSPVAPVAPVNPTLAVQPVEFEESVASESPASQVPPMKPVELVDSLLSVANIWKSTQCFNLTLLCSV